MIEYNRRTQYSIEYRSDIFPLIVTPDNHHSSNVVYWGGGGRHRREYNNRRLYVQSLLAATNLESCGLETYHKSLSGTGEGRAGRTCKNALVWHALGGLVRRTWSHDHDPLTPARQPVDTYLSL